MSDELTPITRKETFLAKAGGQNVVTPTPITREETFLQAIIDNGSGGGGGGGGVLVVGMDMQTLTLDKTWNEINSAPFAVIKMFPDENTTTIINSPHLLWVAVHLLPCHLLRLPQTAILL